MIATNKIELGTLIHGTLRDEDLLQAFSDELARIDETVFSQVIRLDAQLFVGNLTAAEIVEQLGEYASDLIWNMQNALSDLAPAGIYFGNIEGDGSDFGFWEVPSED
tara:strand:+ start:241 stop:561 length:321 start_codon:yes stop_codon:yes gene_type:complete